MYTELQQRFHAALTGVDFGSLRIVEQRQETLQMRQHVLQPPALQTVLGGFITVYDRGGVGYAATSDLTLTGIKSALDQARRWAHFSAQWPLIDARTLPRPQRQAALHYQQTTIALFTSDNIEITQHFSVIAPGLQVIASDGARTQERSGGGWGCARQGGVEQLLSFGFTQEANQTATEALALLKAPNCPAGQMDLLLMPSQMMLQIHESIGHPLELDRILGDERNYAGRSFVTLDMFGSYQYGSPLLNVTFDPTVTDELASYQFDDDGSYAERVHLIRQGVLERPLGGAHNLNVEPGDSTLEELIAAMEYGVLMATNQSWSIDDSRNKFQFGCEYGELIVEGQRQGLVRNPNYRGISATFWRNLAMVGDRSTYEVLGTPHCGKGEPNQIIQVGHASPACLFRHVDVFGGE
ncbi:MAG: TldD/PmbA family protein [Halothiobacillaceae bacterium]|nr:MAG: TldD/PmbA family protein [Halothiobacillaceae bacterium]